LNGGCGEVYRDMWAEQGLLDEIRNQNRFDSLCRPGLRPDLRDMAFRSVWNAIMSLPGDTEAAKLRSHYMFFRNRFHFGVPAVNEWHGYVPFSAMQSRALLSASGLLDPASRTRGRAIYDVTERVLPELNRIPFEDGKTWPREFAPGNQAYRVAPSILSNLTVKQRREYEKFEAARRCSSDANTLKIDRPVPGESIFGVLQRQAGAALAIMRELDTNLAHIFDDGFQGWISNLWRQSPVTAASAASKLLAVYDLCFDTETAALNLPALPFIESFSEAGFSAVTTLLVGRQVHSGSR
jgi:hypothetical protein